MSEIPSDQDPFDQDHIDPELYPEVILPDSTG